MSLYHVHIEEMPNGHGTFYAYHPSFPGGRICSRDPEPQAAYELTKLGLPDGPIQFWRGPIKTLSHSSIHQYAKRCTATRRDGNEATRKRKGKGAPKIAPRRPDRSTGQPVLNPEATTLLRDLRPAYTGLYDGHRECWTAPKSEPLERYPEPLRSEGSACSPEPLSPPTE